MRLVAGESPKLQPITEAGGESVQEKQKARLDEIIQRVNELFEGDLTDQDKLVYVNNVIMGKLLESETLKQQATNNTKEQFANSPDLETELMNAIIGALEAHTAMSTQALGSEPSTLESKTCCSARPGSMNPCASRLSVRRPSLEGQSTSSGCQDTSLEDADSLLEPDVVAQEIAEDLQAAMELFAGIANELKDD